MITIADICTSTFFTNMGEMFTPESPIAGFLTSYADELALNMSVNYNKLPVLDGYDPRINSDLYKLVVARYGRALERIALAMNQIYNPLHNYDMHEKVTNDGEDSHTYSGTDTNTLTNSTQTTNYTQTQNDSLTSGSTYDNTNVQDMKPISKTEHHLSTTQGVQAASSSSLEYGRGLTMEYGRTIETDRSGNIGTTATQKLLEMEYYTRMRLTLFDAVIRACCNTLGCGVWSDE